MTRYRCVDDQKAAGFPVTAACEAAGVSTSGFYDWQAREADGPTDRQVAEAELVELMREIFDAADGNYGVPRMHDELRRAGLRVNHKRVRRLMRLHGMAGRCPRRRCQTTFPGPDGYAILDGRRSGVSGDRPSLAERAIDTIIHGLPAALRLRVEAGVIRHPLSPRSSWPPPPPTAAFVVLAVGLAQSRRRRIGLLQCPAGATPSGGHRSGREMRVISPSSTVRRARRTGRAFRAGS